MRKKIRIAYFVLCFGLIMIVTLLNSEYFIYNLQKYLSSFSSIRVGSSLISMPDNWFVLYKKDKQDSYGLSYGYIPYKLSNQPHCLAFFVIKKLSAENKVTFCEMNSDAVVKSKIVLDMLQNNPNNDFKVLKVGEFVGLTANLYRANSLVDVPTLGISISANNIEDLSSFTFNSSQ